MPHRHRKAFGSGRRSRQRTAVLGAVEDLAGAFTVAEVAREARRVAPEIGTATMYRAISAMVESGHIERVGSRGMSALYARCAEGHHHHLVCTSCGATAIAHCPVIEQDSLAADPDGFLVTGHELRLFGLCASCRPGEAT